jgi:hypothetical protein
MFGIVCGLIVNLMSEQNAMPAIDEDAFLLLSLPNICQKKTAANSGHKDPIAHRQLVQRTFQKHH